MRFNYLIRTHAVSTKPTEFKLIRVSKFRKRYFEGTAPSIDSIKNMIRLGELKGKKLAGVYYVIIDDDFITDNNSSLIGNTSHPILGHDEEGYEIANRILRKYSSGL